MGRKQNIINIIKLNKEIKRWRKIELSKKHRAVEKNIIRGHSLTKEEINLINNYFIEHTGKKIDLYWHLKYKTISGHFDYKYFPDIYYNADLKHLMNDKYYVEVYSNKYVLSKIIKGSGLDVLTPENVISCNDGVMLDHDDNLISKEDAIRHITNKQNLFFKNSVGTYGGDGCTLYETVTQEDAIRIIKSGGNNFLLQKTIKNQKDLFLLNPSTLNTFRIITYYCGDKIYTAPLILRIGRKNGQIDNAHAGGMFVGVDDNGYIISDAKTVKGDTIVKHPDTGIVFKGYFIKNIPLLRETAIKLAALLPQTKLVDWDLTLNEEGKPVCIEANIDSGSIWLMQMTHGVPVFRNQTEQMLNMVKNVNTFKQIINEFRKHTDK